MTQDSAALTAELFSEFDELAAVAAATRIRTADAFTRTLQAWIDCVQGGGKILFFGNGGSAAQAQHLSAELIVRYRDDRRSIAGITLTADTSILTAGGNDYGFEQVFSRQIEGLGRPGDLAFGFSTSGKSSNVNKALIVAKDMGLRLGGMCGRDGGEMAALVPDLIIVPSSTTSRIQEMHLTLGHMLCVGLERALNLV